MIKRIQYGDGKVTLAEIENKKSQTRIYFLQCQDTRLIKIGIAIDVSRRVTDIQGMCPTELNLLTSIKGDRWTEDDLHRRFAHARLHGEWFYPVNELMELIGAEIEKDVEFGDQITARLEARRNGIRRNPRLAERLEPDADPLRELVLVTGLSKQTCKSAIDRGELPGYRDGEKYVVPEHELMLFRHGRWSRRKTLNDVRHKHNIGVE